MQYVDDPRNGLTLCSFKGNDCHHRIHEAKLKVDKRWLPKAVLECLEEQGVGWDDEGQPYGPCWKYLGVVEPKKESHD